MLEDAIKSYVLIQSKSNIHLEEGDRVLELSQNGLKDYFDVDEIRLTR